MQYLASLGVVFVGCVIKTDASKFGFAELSLRLVQEWAWLLVVVLGATAGISRLACHWIGPPWVWKSIRAILEKFRQEAFQIDEIEPTHYHRVTLFQRKSFRIRVSPWRSKCWPYGRGRGPFSGWLVPVCRTGRATQRTFTAFLAPDDADCAEGVAGKAWACNAAMHVELPSVDSNSSTEDIQRYADNAFLPVQLVHWRLKANRALPRRLCGIPVEVDNKIWGVLVLDSRKENSIRSNSHAWPTLEKIVPLALQEILKRV